MTSMTRISRAAFVAALASARLAAAPAALHAQATPPAPLPVKPATLPRFQEATLPNGLRVLLVESHRHPVLSLALMLPAGNAYNPPGKDGLGEMVASTITKGAGSRTAEQVANAIESVGGSLSAGTGVDFMTVRANVLSANAPLAFELVGDAVARPTFATKEVELARTQQLSALQLDQSNPAALAQRYFRARLYGQHPYGRSPSTESVRSLTAGDLRAFQHDRLVPRGALLVVAGDIALPRVRALAQRYFGSWRGAPAASAPRPAPPSRSRTEIVLVHRPGSVQSNIVVGNLTFPPADERFYALTVADKILGGGTEGRLFSTLREKRSWTYGAYSSLSRNRDIGVLVATAEVRNPVTDSALTELLSIERSLGTTPVPATELENARNALVGRLPLQLETAQGIAETVGRYTMLGLPMSYIRTQRPRLAAVTAAQVLAAAHDAIRADQALVVVVGDGAQIYDRLARVAPVQIISAQGDVMQPSDLVARATSLPVDAALLAEHADSFAVNVQGAPMGWLTTRLVKTPAGFAYRTTTQVGAMMHTSMETAFGADITPRSVKGSGTVGPMAVSSDITYANGRVKGTSVSPSVGGPKSVAVDTTVAPGVLDDNMLSAVLPALRWAPGAKFTVGAFDASVAAVRPLTLAVAGTESVTVPAGTFPTYRVEMTGGQAPVTFWVTTEAPHRIVKFAPVGQPVEFVLVK